MSSRRRAAPRNPPADRREVTSRGQTTKFANKILAHLSQPVIGIERFDKPRHLNILKLFQIIRDRVELDVLHERGFFIFIEVNGIFRTLTTNYVTQVIDQITQLEDGSDPLVNLAIADQNDYSRFVTRSGRVEVIPSTRNEMYGEYGFFMFLNTSKYDLRDLQIYTEEDYLNKRVNLELCVKHAIEKYAEVMKMTLPPIRISHDYISDCKVSWLYMKRIGEENGIDLRVHRYNKDGDKFNAPEGTSKKGFPIVHVAEYKGHMFPFLTRRNWSTCGLYRNSLELVVSLDKRGLLKPLPYDIREKSGQRFDERLERGQLEVRDEHFLRSPDSVSSPHPDDWRWTCYFDTEKTTDIVDLTDKSQNVHQQYMLSFAFHNEDVVRTYRGSDSSKRFIEYLLRHVPRNYDKGKPNKDCTAVERKVATELRLPRYYPPMGRIVLIAHNLSYDISGMFPMCTCRDQWYGTLTKIKGVTLSYLDLELSFLDSYNHIQGKLKDLPAIVSLSEEERKTIRKEVMPYAVYTRQSVYESEIDVKEAYSVLDSEEKKEFMVVAKDFIHGDKFRHMDYAQFYCEQDVRVLKTCFERNRVVMWEALRLDPLGFLTSSSLSLAFFTNSGVFEEVTKVGGSTRAFIQDSIDGGRVLPYRQNMIDVHDTIIDMDARALYPSAMYFLGGYPVGKGKQLTTKQLNLETLRTFDAYFVRVKVLRYRRERSFPILYEKIDGRKKYIFSNPNGHEQVLNNVSFECLLKYHELTEEDYELIEGVYYNEGVNTRIKDVIKYVYDKRSEHKAAKSPLQASFKLIMNSGYGVLCKKPIRTRVELRYYKTSEERDEALMQIVKMLNCYSYVREEEGNYKILLEKRRVGKTHYSYNHIASLILAKSKELMYRVCEIVEELGGHVYYTDTDSVHIPRSILPQLCSIFKERYGYEFDGDNMGQYHSDFEIKGSFSPLTPKAGPWTVRCVKDKSGSVVQHKFKYIDMGGVERLGVYNKPKNYFTTNNPEEYSQRLIALSAKTYVHQIRYLKIDGDVLRESIHAHWRMKGIPGNAMEDLCDREESSRLRDEPFGAQKTIIKIFEDLLKGEVKKFDLLANGRVSFEFLKGCRPISRVKFTREIGFSSSDTMQQFMYDSWEILPRN